MEPYLSELKVAIEKEIDKLKEDLKGIRASRPSPQLIEDIKVEYSGEFLALKQLGSISIKPPREINLNVWDTSIVSKVMKAIEEAKLGVSLSNEGNMVKVFLPPLSEERRAELTKLVKRLVEETKIKIRYHRDEANKRIKSAQNNKEINEDQFFRLKEKIQDIVDEANKNIESILKDKLKSLEE